MPKYFDIHSHLNFKDFEGDLDAVIQRLRDTETHTIVVGTDYESSKQAVELAEKYDEIYASIGVHPVDNPIRVFNDEGFKELMKSKRVVAVGECGFDFFHAKREDDYERQEKLFDAQIEFAIDHNKPLMIHSRGAYQELLDKLERLKEIHGERLRGDIHFFAGTLDEAKRFWAIGFSTSFTGVITFARDYDGVIKNAPLEMLMSETDSPYVAPFPHRGKRNEPSYVSEVVKKIAEIRGEDVETIRAALVANAIRMIG